MGLKVLVAHNFYGNRAIGGEATVFAQETELLRRNGCEVRTFERSNAEILEWPLWQKCALPFRFGRSSEIYRQMVEMIEDFRPDILHAHNYKYALTPSIFEAAKDCGVKTVLTLHNYRLICPGGQLRRGNKICEECLKKHPSRVLWRRGCASKWSTRVLQALFYFETKRAILRNVDAFVALTKFSKSKFAEGGLPEDRIWVKPNFIFDPWRADERVKRGEIEGASRLEEGEREEEKEGIGGFAGLREGGETLRKAVFGENRQDRKGAVFVGRLSAEKGVRFLIDAWRGVDFPLTVVGGGPELEAARRNATENVRFVGEKSREETLKLLQSAQFLVFPSICYEGFPMSILEASALGTPTLASNLGGRGETTVDGETGLLFESGNVDDFRGAARRLIAEPEFCRRLGEGARRRYEELYSPEKNFETLMSVYRALLG